MVETLVIFSIDLDDDDDDDDDGGLFLLRNGN